MEEMTAREYLNQIRVQDAKITRLIQEKETLRSSLLPGGMSYQEHVQSSPDLDPYGTWATRLEEKEAEINREIDRLADLRLEVSEKVWQLKNTKHATVLHMRHVQLKSFRDIAEYMKYSKKYIHNLYRNALEEFDEMIYISRDNATTK